MSRIALLVSLVLALALGLLAVYTLWGTAGGKGTGSTIGIVSLPEGDLHSLRVEYHQGQPVEVRRGPLPDLWLMHDGVREYPVIPARVRAMLRLLAESRVAPAGNAPDLPPPATVSLRRRDGSQVTLELLGEPLGGRGTLRVAIGGASVLMTAPDGVHQIFRRPALLAWRSNAPFPAGTAGASRLSLRAADDQGGRVVSLARAAGHWTLVEPLAAPADPAAVASLLDALDRTVFQRFVEPDAETPDGVRVVVESDIRQFEGEVVVRRVLAQSLTIVGPGSDRTALARLEGTLRGPDGVETVLWTAVAQMRVDGLAELHARPEAYLSPVAFTGAAADVRWIGLGAEGRERWFRRDLETWLFGRGADAGIPLSSEDAAMVRRLVDLLCTVRAARAALADDVPFEPTLELWLGAGPAEPRARFEAGWVAGPDGRTFAAVRAGPVVRLYERHDPLEWLLTRP